MANYNKVILVGNLTRDPQMSYLPSQTAVVEFGLAVNRRYKTQDGQQRDETCFIDCRAYGKQAETLNQYMSKGRPILVEGRLQFDAWEGKDGVKRNKHRVIVERFQFLGQAGKAPSRPAAMEQPSVPPDDSWDNSGEPAPPASEAGRDDDIPF